MRIVPWVGLFALLVTACLVFWAFHALPFMDLPAHAGLMAVRHRYAGSPVDQSFFTYAPRLGPYSLFRTLGDLACGWLGPLGAVRLLATLPAVATPCAVLWARWTLHRDLDPSWAALSVPLGFGLMTAFGFASYMFGLSFAVVGATLWFDYLRTPTFRRALYLAFFAPLVFIAHGHAWLLLLCVSGASLLGHGGGWRRMGALTIYAPSALLALWVAFRNASEEDKLTAWVSCSEANIHFQGPIEKLSLLLTPTLMTRTGVDAALGVVVWILLLAALRRSIVAPATQGEQNTLFGMLASLVALSAVFLALPHTIRWFGFVDGRLVLPILLLIVLAVRPVALGSAFGSWFRALSWLVASAQLVVVLIASYEFQKEAAGYEQVLAAIPEGARLLHLPLSPDSRVFTGHPFVHYDKLALAERPLLPSDIWYHQGTALYPRPDSPVWHLPTSYCGSNLKVIDWSTYRLSDWDYVLARVDGMATPTAVPNSLIPVAQHEGLWLWRNTSR